ncbi:MAG TPA: pyruvate dehydrogenase (acetyl-transferring), homodimeric type [Actinomycetota bacterium]|nr:pyruvate dehydrogenase (acetyl-transferring), homodimeric type [Actinomycetota bacterium]
MIIDGFARQVPDMDPEETAEWLESFQALVDARGKTRARYLLIKLLERARELQVGFPATVSTHYVNTIPADKEPPFPGDEHIERRIRAFIRWNAAVMVTRANMLSEGIGGHLATYASSASLYEVGFNHFFHGRDGDHPGDLVMFQGHAAPGIYARAFLEGRFDEDRLDHFRRELGGRGLSSYPHPRLMPEFWEFPTVSMGLSPLASIYQARFNRYLHHRGITDTSQSKVWCFVGDGETDEPETLGSLSLAGREQLDNLIWVVNCNLQRLDGPVRGNGKIVQELEAIFRGAGWNVIKVIWGRKWDELLANDHDGLLVAKMDSTVDGEFQKYATEQGSYIREHFFGPDEQLKQMVAHLSDEELRMLPRGGHDYQKLYAGYQAAIENEGSPTVILAKTIKGWTLGPDIEARNVTHQIKKMSSKQLRELRERLYLQEEVPEESIDQEDEMPPYYRPPEGSEIHDYLMERRRSLGGSVPKRRTTAKALPQPADETFGSFFEGSKGRAVSTTMALTGIIRALMRDKTMGTRVVPIIPDEARTFGMDPLFAEFGIYAPFGQLYEPVDAGMLLTYKESKTGQILEEGITEAGSMASMQAAGSAYATWDEPMIPFFIFYSMFGFQRVGDLIWQFGDIRGRGFLCGGTAGRTTLNGEGLQHEDGHSLVLSSTVPNIRTYDPAFAYELALIVQDGIKRMFGEKPEDVFYYLTLYNENYPMPPMPDGVADGVLRGLYRYEAAPEGPSRRATILFSGPAWKAATEARDLLAAEHDVAAELWSATSYKLLREDALSAERWARLHPGEPAPVPYVTASLSDAGGPVIAVSDFMKSVPEMVSRWVPGPFVPLGTDGYGRSDTRAALRRHFEVDAGHVIVATLHGLAQAGEAKAEEVTEAIERYEIDTEAPDPRTA